MKIENKPTIDDEQIITVIDLYSEVFYIGTESYILNKKQRPKIEK